METKLIPGEIMFRPSKKIKSPYLADVKINNKIELTHSPGLGLCGYITKGSKVLMLKNVNEKRKSKYTIEMVEIKNEDNKIIWLGANPLRSNELFLNLVLQKKIPILGRVNKYKPEFKFLNSRFDFFMETHVGKFIIEIKNVPIVDFMEKNKPNNKAIIRNTNEKRSAIFPDGYQKKGDCVSPRAFRQLDDLIEIKRNYKEYIPMCCYLVQRDDVYYFKPNFKKDIKYSNKLKQAFEEGVLIKAFKFKVSPKGYKFIKEIPVKLS